MKKNLALKLTDAVSILLINIKMPRIVYEQDKVNAQLS